MNDGKTLVEELKWIKRELANLKIARNSSTRAAQAAVAAKSQAKVITKSIEAELPGNYEDSKFTIEITPVSEDNNDSSNRVKITVTGMKDFSVSLVEPEG